MNSTYTRSYIKKSIMKGYDSNTDTLNLTIELNRKCNLNCIYCYQRGTFHKNEISYKTIDSIIKYVNYCIERKGKNKIRINFIGGEPMLSIDKLLYIEKEISDIARKNKLKYDFILNTNGTLLEKNIVKEMSNTSFAITLSLENDHNLNRPGNGFNSYSKILKGIHSCYSYFKTNNNDLSIRYNTNENNIGQFSEFLYMLRINNIRPDDITPMYTDEYSNTTFKNKLSKADILKWNSNDAINILIKNDYSIYYTPKCMFSPCKAYFNDNFKFFCDGAVGLCDASKYIEGMPNINKIKKWNPLLDNMCAKCNKLAFCGGK